MKCTTSINSSSNSSWVVKRGFNSIMYKHLLTENPLSKYYLGFYIFLTNRFRSLLKNLSNKYLTGKTDSTLIQLIRYTFIGGLAYIVDFGSLFILTEFFNIYYLTSAAIAFTFGLIINFSLSIVWVFNKRRLNNKWVEFAIYVIIGIVGLGFNELFIWFFTGYLFFHYLVSKIISTVFIYLWNFFARKYILFS